MEGIIKTLTKDRGFGFIRAETGQEFFFHKTGLLMGVRFEELTLGDRVRFEEDDDNRKGPRACDVELI